MVLARGRAPMPESADCHPSGACLGVMGGVTLRCGRGALAVLFGVVSAGMCLWPAAQHPLAPMLALSLISAVLAWAMWRPADLWFVLPALLPVASFTPWTGWWLADESDLLVLAALGGAYLRWGLDAWRSPDEAYGGTPSTIAWVYRVLPPLLVLGVWRGLDDARGTATWAALLNDIWAQGLHGDYDLPGNTLRVAKSLAWGLLLMPVLYRWPQAAALRLARGMVVGLSFVSISVLWERGLYVGWLDFSTSYRTVAWFWEMHVGGGAIDAYLAMALPFAWWAAWSAPHGWRWYAAAALVLLAVYAVLTTYSRGLHVTVLVTAIGLALLARKYQLKAPDVTRWHRTAMACLLVALVLETAAVSVGGVFMSDRLGRSTADLYQRAAHWQRGVDLLKTPTQWVFGLGIGRLPAHYSTQTTEGALPGRVRWTHNSDGGNELWLYGPQSAHAKGGLALAQHVRLESSGRYQVRLRAHWGASPTWVKVQLCQQYLLYQAQCQLRTRQVSAASKTAGGWIVLPLLGPDLASTANTVAWGNGVLSIQLLQANAAVHIDAIELLDPGGRQLLRNPDLAMDPRYWSSIAYGNFLPWHMDNLLLDVLIERGLLGLVVLATLVLGALMHLVRNASAHTPLTFVVGGSISAALMAGMLVGFVEIPRVNLVLLLLVIVSFRPADPPDVGLLKA